MGIFLILDPQDEVFDRRLGRHLVSLYYRSQEATNEENLDMGLLRDYLAYAKQTFHPKLTEEAGTLLTQSYVKMRQIGSGRGQITAYPRQLESLIRLAEAHARMRFSHHVEVVDVEEATRLQREALKQSAIDPSTGAIKKSLQDLIGKKGKVQTINYQKTWNELKENSDVMITREMFEDALKDLSDDGFVTLTGRATIRVNQ